MATVGAGAIFIFDTAKALVSLVSNFFSPNNKKEGSEVSLPLCPAVDKELETSKLGNNSNLNIESSSSSKIMKQKLNENTDELTNSVNRGPIKDIHLGEDLVTIIKKAEKTVVATVESLAVEKLESQIMFKADNEKNGANNAIEALNRASAFIGGGGGGASNKFRNGWHPVALLRYPNFIGLHHQGASHF